MSEKGENSQNEELSGAAESIDTEKKVEEYTEQSFLDALAWTSKAYLLTVIICAAVAAAGVAVAVIVKVSYGLICALCAVVAYIGAVNNILYKRLGVAHKSESGRLTVTEYYGKNRDEAWIPRRLLWLDVTALGDEAFDHESSKNIKVVHLPRTLRHVGKDVFKGCESIERICFEGSRSEWEEIESETDLGVYTVEFEEKIAYPEQIPLKARYKSKKKPKKAKRSVSDNADMAADAGEKEK